MTNLEQMLEARLTEKMTAQTKENTASLSDMMDQMLLKAMDLAAHHTGTQIKESQAVVLDQMTLMMDTLATRLESGRRSSHKKDQDMEDHEDDEASISSSNLAKRSKKQQRTKQ